MKLPSLREKWQNWKQEMPLAVAQISHQKMRSAVALAGISFANILIFMQLGFRAILFDGVTRVHEQLDGELFLLSDSAQYMGDQTFSRRHLYQAEAVEGVESASPFYYSQSSWRNPEDSKQVDVTVMAFNPSQPVLTMPAVNENLDTIQLPDTVLFDDQSQATLGPIAENLEAGETVKTEVGGREITVADTYSLGSTLFRSGHIITSDQNYIRLFGSDSADGVQVGVIDLEPSADLAAVQAGLDLTLPDEVQVLTLDELTQMEEAYWAQMPAGIIFNFGAAMGFIVGVVIVYQVLYSDVSDHLPEYATMKAMGYSGKQLLAIIFQEALILAVLGFLPGYSLSIGMYTALGALTRIPVAMRPDVAIQVFLMTVAMCSISGAIASRKLQAADPADIF